jgi:hypothetical protein
MMTGENALYRNIPTAITSFSFSQKLSLTQRKNRVVYKYLGPPVNRPRASVRWIARFLRNDRATAAY